MSSKVPLILYYNCSAPVKIIYERRIRVSRINGRDRGVSMSSWSEMGSHGPFKIAFKRSKWFDQFGEVLYGPHPRKNPMFKSEREWNSIEEVLFDIGDVTSVVFMTNAPCVISRRKLWAEQNRLQVELPGLYMARVVDDPYLRGEVCA